MEKEKPTLNVSSTFSIVVKTVENEITDILLVKDVAIDWYQETFFDTLADSIYYEVLKGNLGKVKEVKEMLEKQQGKTLGLILAIERLSKDLDIPITIEKEDC